MEKSKKFIESAGYVPYISFKKTPRQTFKIISEKEDTITDVDGSLKQGMSYLVEFDGGNRKKFFTGSLGLIAKLAELPLGSNVTIELKRKSFAGKIKSFYEVSGEGISAPNDIPVENDIEHKEEDLEEINIV